MKKFFKKIIAMLMPLSMLGSISINANAQEIVVPDEENTVLYGDANCDDNVDIRDIAFLKKHLVGLDELSAKGLENCGFFNNTVTVKSLGQITKYLIKDVDELQFSYYDDGIYDEYIPKDNITEDYNFEDDVVIVSIKHQYSEMNKIWTKENFGIDNISYIKDITHSNKSDEEIENYLNMVTFRQILFIYLEETGKDKVLKMIDDLEEQNITEIQCISVSSCKYILE